MRTKLMRFIFVILIGIAILSAVHAVQAGSANVPFLDQFWFVAPTAISVADGVISPLALLTWNSEHRSVFTMFTNIVSVILTGWNTNFEVWVNLGLAVVVFALIVLIVARFHYASEALWLGVPIAFLIFGARQGDNWMRGYSHFLYGAIFMLLALWFLMRLKVGWRAWWAVMLCTFAASWSFAGGLTLWGFLLLALWLREYRRWQYYAAWLAAAAICISLYFIGYQSTGLERDSAQLTVLDYIVNALRYLGAPLAPHTLEHLDLALVVGGVGVLLVGWHLIYLWERVPKYLLAVPIVLTLYSVANALLSVYGRSWFVINMPISVTWPRYATQANFLWVALLLLGGLSFQQASRTQLHAISSLILLVAAPMYLLANHHAIQWITTYSFKPSRACFLNYLQTFDTPCFQRLINDRKYLDTIVELAERRLSTFGDWQVDFPPAAQPALAHVQPILGTVGDVPRWVDDSPEATALFQHPPSTAEQHLQLPDALQVFFEAEIYVDLTNIRQHPDVPQTGADFRLGIREGRHVRTLYEGGFDVHTETAPIPIRVDLSAWRGKAVVLVYETLVRQGNPNYAWAMWRNPRLVTQ
ncbi:MAG: hypothetical protein SNJ58_11955 [Aggregatilineales bacterium]